MIQRHKAALTALLTATTLLTLAGLAGCVPPVTSLTSQFSETTAAVTTPVSEHGQSTSVPTETPVISPVSQTSVSPTATSLSVTPTVTSTTAPSATDIYLTTEQATTLACDRVGDAARILSVEADFDDNPPIYEIELADGTYLYELEIHAITGAILEYERSRAEDESDDESHEADIND